MIVLPELKKKKSKTKQNQNSNAKRNDKLQNFSSPYLSLTLLLE